MPKTYGRVRFDSKKERWIIEGEPHILLRFKRIFERAWKGAEGKVTIEHTDEVCRDLVWFMQRYSLGISKEDRDLLHGRSNAFDERILTLERIVGTGQVQRKYEMALPAREYQKVAAEIVLTQGHLLIADDVGLGKTVEAIAALTDPSTRPAAVVTLAGAMPKQWADEIKRFLPGLNVHVLKKATPYEIPKFMGHGPDVLVLNYHKLAGWGLVLRKYCKMIVFDEIQELRRRQSNRYKAAEDVAKEMRYKIGLSATPIYNYGGEIWNLFNVIAPKRLGTRSEFQREWCGEPGIESALSKEPPIKNPKALGTYLREQFLMLRRTRHDVARELPPVSKIVQTVDADREELNKVKDSASELARIILGQTDRELEKGEAMRAAEELSWKLRQATGVDKAPYAADFVRLLVESSERVVVYLWHRAVYRIFQEKLEEYGPLMFTGSETPAQKTAAKELFLRGKSPVMLMSLRAGAGIDGLQKVCRTVVFGELDWSPGIHEQALGRVYRDGQPDPVTAYFLVSETGSDPVVSERLGLKRAQIEGIRDPKRDLLEKLESGAERTKALAKHYLKSIGQKLPDETKNSSKSTAQSA